MSKEYKYYTKAIPLPNGKRKYIRAKTKRELNQKVFQFQMDLAQGNVVVPNDMTVAQLAALWLETVKKPAMRAQSYENYRQAMECHVLPAIGDMLVSEVRSAHIYNMMNSHGYASRDSNKKLLTHTRALFAFAVENKLVSDSPVPKRIGANGKSPRQEKPLTPNQTKALLDYCKQDKDPNVYLFTLIALVTGMRRGEIAGLRWDCVDFQTNEIKVRRQLVSQTGEITDNLKTEAARREIPFSAELAALLHSVRADSISTYVVAGTNSGHIGSSVISRYQAVWNRAGVAPFTIHPHLLRKTFATRLIETGTDPKRVQYLLGHETLDMTLKIYAMYDKESQRSATRDLLGSTFGSYVSMG